MPKFESSWTIPIREGEYRPGYQTPPQLPRDSISKNVKRTSITERLENRSKIKVSLITQIQFSARGVVICLEHRNSPILTPAGEQGEGTEEEEGGGGRGKISKGGRRGEGKRKKGRKEEEGEEIRSVERKEKRGIKKRSRVEE